MRVALVHDYLTQFGGAERVLLALMDLFPHAPVYTLVFDPDSLPHALQPKGKTAVAKRVRTSFLQRWPGAKRHHRLFPLLMPLATEQFNLSQYDVVLSVSHSFGKGIVVGPHTLHLSYCFTPIRYVWDDSHRYVREFSTSQFVQRFAPAALSYIRLWDYYAAQRVDHYLTSSQYVASRITKYYHRSAEVVPPPVDVERFSLTTTDEDYYLVVSRLVSYKRVELAIHACQQLKRKLKIAGIGPEIDMLRRKADPAWTEFLGFVPDDQLHDLYAKARALLFPQEEDFGITPLEAAACGKPTIAYGAGGALETIIDGTTGVLFSPQTIAGLVAGIRRFEDTKWEPGRIRQHAFSFSREAFLQKMGQVVHSHWMSYQAARV